MKGSSLTGEAQMSLVVDILKKITLNNKNIIVQIRFYYYVLERERERLVV